MTSWKQILDTLQSTSTELEIAPGGDGATFNQCVDLENFSRFQSMMVTHKNFVGLEIVTVDAVIASTDDLTFAQLTSHPSFSQQPFGLYIAGEYWFISATLPLRHLDLDDFYAIVFKVAWVADMIRQSQNLEMN